MIRSLLKILVLSAIVLLAGQVSVRGKTVAEHYTTWLGRGVKWTENEWKKSQLHATLANTSLLSRWINNVYPPKPEDVTEHPTEKEGITASDRESILRLLD